MKRFLSLILAGTIMLSPIIGRVYASDTSLYLTENIPNITLPVVTQESFADSFNVLEDAVVDASDSNPVYGFTYPFCAPGGAYGACWWQLDTSLALSGAKWANQRFAENVLRGFMEVQREDGRLPLHGPDALLNEELKCSSLPKLFKVSYEVLSRTEDEQLIKDTYNMLKKYLDWWLTARRHEETGLILGIVEEYLPGASTFSIPVETNVEVIEGCIVVSKLAEYLGYTEDMQKYTQEAENLKNAVNTYMWDDKNGRYTSLRENGKPSLKAVWSVACFDVLRNNIANQQNIDTLLEDLTDDTLFQWDTYPLTSAAKTDNQYNETPGDYAALQWYGSIWSLRNYSVIEGLEDIGRFDLAAYLALKTVEIFDGNYAEFLNPPDGSGQGVLRYSWTASQYIQIIIEHIFGIKYDSFTDTLTISPMLDKSLMGQTISLRDLLLPDGGKLSVTIKYEADAIRISYETDGAKNFRKIISMPAYNQEFAAVGKNAVKETAGVYGSRFTVDNQLISKDEIIFTDPALVNNFTYNPPTDDDTLRTNGTRNLLLICIAVASVLIIFGILIYIKKERKGKNEG